MVGEEQAWTADADGPVMIIGTERSGSNLLRLMLAAHSRICIPHPPHLLRYLAPIASTYGDLTVVANRRMLIRDAVRIVRAHPHPWETAIDVDAVVDDAPHSVVGVMEAIYEQARRGSGKARWGCKSTFVVEHVDAVRSALPHARFVWLVRDPRDVAASGRRAVFGPCEPVLTAELWRRQQEMAAAALEEWGPSVVHLLRYEDLVADPEAELARLCRFLGEELEPAMLRPEGTDAARRMSRLSASWAGTARPPNQQSVGRHRDDLTPLQRQEAEAAAGPLLQELGYALDAPPGRSVRRSRAAIWTADQVGRAKVEYRSLRGDANHWLRLRRDAVVTSIRARARLRRAIRRWRRAQSQVDGSL